jgi:PIN domain nuclease of toxin-antitoxin system
MEPEKLSENAIEIISGHRDYDELLLSCISPWEFCKLLEKGKIGIKCEPEEWLRLALPMSHLRLVGLSPTGHLRLKKCPLFEEQVKIRPNPMGSPNIYGICTANFYL